MLFAAVSQLFGSISAMNVGPIISARLSITVHKLEVIVTILAEVISYE